MASALVERDGRLLLVRNVRRGGIEDWSTPGGVIDADDVTLLEGLAREVLEETGLRVHAWEGPIYEVVAEALDMGWRMRCEVHIATHFDGELTLADPDGIVVEAAFCDDGESHERIATCPAWVREPLADWIATRWPAPIDGEHRRYHYAVHGTGRADMRVLRRPAR